MKTVVFLTLLIFIAPAAARADGDQMSDWLPILKAAIDSSEDASPSFPKEMSVATKTLLFKLCGHLEGIMAMMRFAEMDHPGTYKFPKDYTTPQLLRIVNKYVQYHPERLNMNELIFVTMALNAQFSVSQTK